MHALKLTPWLLALVTLTAVASTEEELHRRFTVAPGGTLVVDVDVGAIAVTGEATGEVVVNVWRRVTRSSKSAEATYLKDHPVSLAQDGDTVTVRCRERAGSGFRWFGRSGARNEARYEIRVPARFNARLKTAGGGIHAASLAGEVRADTSGGGLRFERLEGPLHGHTSGGGIRVADCTGDLRVDTSGGGIEVTGGSGSLRGDTSGGGVTVKDFRGRVRVGSSGGGLTLEGVVGPLEGSTSGGPIAAVLPAPVPEEVRLSTSGGGVTLRVPEQAAFQLDASTSGGRVSSELPVTVVGKIARDRLQGAVNGGGKPVVLRSSGGSIHVKKL